MSSIRRLLFLQLMLLASVVYAQDKPPVKFGEVGPQDFTITQPFDSGAGAVVIADIGKSYFESSTDGRFRLRFERKCRVKILNKQGLRAANLAIDLYSNGSTEELLEDLKGHTYNLVNGNVTDTRLDNASVFKDRLDKDHVVKKCVLPAVVEGSIIEYTYSIKSIFITNLQPWSFQGEFPCLWSEYETAVPDFFHYVTIAHGNIPIKADKKKGRSNYHVLNRDASMRSYWMNVAADVFYNHWLVKNLPPISEDNFISSVENYSARVEFQMTEMQFSPDANDEILDWVTLAKKLSQDEHFGDGLYRNNNWLDADLPAITKDCHTALEKARKIYAFVRDNFACTNHNRLWMEGSVKDVYKNKSGNEAELNLLLATMLIHEKIDASPVILSTRDNGYVNEVYPQIDHFNYVAVRARIGEVDYSMDASDRYCSFGRLPGYCYNGHARLITREGSLPVYYEADSLKEQKLVSVFVGGLENGRISGTIKSRLGHFESAALREELQGKPDDYRRNHKLLAGNDALVSDVSLDNLDRPDTELVVNYKASINFSGENDLIYFSPILTGEYSINPLPAETRLYPVEMPYAPDLIYTLNLEIPEGWVVDDLPKSVKVFFNENEGFFEYAFQKTETAIQLRSRVKFNKANFDTEDYENLRNFFAFIIKKQNEQIVFRKKPRPANSR